MFFKELTKVNTYAIIHEIETFNKMSLIDNKQSKFNTMFNEVHEL